MYNNLFLDSGAFSADKSGNPIDIDAYMKFIHENKDDISIYANLDVIGDWPATWTNQRIMEAEGLTPIPVHHLEDPMKCLDWCLDYDYFALGGIAGGATTKDRIRFFDKCWNVICDKDGFPKSKVHGFGMASPSLIKKWPWYCMTEEDHEVLTKSGWKFRKDLSLGEEVFTFDKGKSLWEPILDIPTFDVQGVDINIWENRNFKSFTTDNHNWIVSNSKKQKRGNVWENRTTNQIYGDDVIPRVGTYTFPTKKKYDDNFIGLLGWFWTDGTHKKRKRCKNDCIGISQSLRANPQKCKEIEKLLIASNEKYCKWISGEQMQSFELYGEMSKKLLKLAPNKKLPLHFIFDLTKKQLEKFIYSSVQGDGTKTALIRKKGWTIKVSRKIKKENLEVLRIACLLLGIPTSISEKGQTKILTTSSVDWIYVNKLKTERTKYTGKLWCLQVASKSFFTRCNNKIYVTGNSIDSSSWVAYGRYGIVILPKVDINGQYDYFVSPVKVFVSDKSTKKGVDGVHYNTLSENEKLAFDNYLKFHNLPFGDENTKGVSNDNFWRDLTNYLFFTAMCDQTLDYPWAWKRPSIKTFF